MTPSPPPASAHLAAIDLGSNSFHLTIAREVQGELQLIDRLGEKVQLASGLDVHNELDPSAIDRGLACLERFAQRIRIIAPENLRVVGTNTLRAARNRDAFTGPAERILGVPVEVIAGREEARLIYLGVAHCVADDQEQRLVIDIGGGSTELIIGQRFSPQKLESLHMGCVSYTRRFFADGGLDDNAFRRAINAAHLELLNIRRQYRELGWQDVVGSSGTIKACYRLLVETGQARVITLAGLRRLQQHLQAFNRIDRIDLPGIKPNRAQVLPGGVAILIAIFEGLALDGMHFSDGALREGLLYDHIGRQQHEDVRERSLSALIARYQADPEQAARVEATALYCLQQTGLDNAGNRELLRRASRLHEIGLAISHSQFQKHGAYLIENSDLMGFNQHEQQQLALLVRGHRRKFPRLELDNLTDSRRQSLTPLLLVLRLAVLLHHGRQSDPLPDFQLRWKPKGKAVVKFPAGWLRQQPLIHADLAQEAEFLQQAGLELGFG